MNRRKRAVNIWLLSMQGSMLRHEVSSFKLPSLPTRIVVMPPRIPLVQYERIIIRHHVTESEETNTCEEPEETHCALRCCEHLSHLHNG